MLPAFKNVLRIVDHGEATWIGSSFLMVKDVPVDSFGYLTALTLDGYNPVGSLVRIDPETFRKGMVTLSALI